MSIRTAQTPSRRRLGASWGASILLLAMTLLTACMLEPASEPELPAASAQSSAEISSKKDSGIPGVPAGCTRVYSPAKADSVLDCPEVRPPRPL